MSVRTPPAMVAAAGTARATAAPLRNPRRPVCDCVDRVMTVITFRGLSDGTRASPGRQLERESDRSETDGPSAKAGACLAPAPVLLGLGGRPHADSRPASARTGRPH